MQAPPRCTPRPSRSGDDLDLLEVAERQVGVHVAAVDNQHGAAFEAPCLHHGLGLLGGRLLELEVLDHGELAVGQLGGKRAAHGQLDDLAVHLLGVGTRMRSEDHAAARPMRCADGALTRTAGALLAPRLLAAATDLTAGEGVAGALAPRSALGSYDFMHDGHVRLDVEHAGGKLEVLDLLAGCILNFDVCHFSLLLGCFMPGGCGPWRSCRPGPRPSAGSGSGLRQRARPRGCGR